MVQWLPQDFCPSGTNSIRQTIQMVRHMPRTGNSENRHKKKRSTMPNNSKIVDLHCYGFQLLKTLR